MNIGFIGLNLLYLSLLMILGIYLRKLFRKVDIEPEIDFTPLPVSVLIPVHNEEEHITDLIKALEEQDYNPDLIEIIFIDDESTDQTATKIKYFAALSPLNIKYLYSKRERGKSSKKIAITKGVQEAQNELIILIDADVRMKKNWISSVVFEWNREKVDFLPGLVTINYWERENFFARLQALDFVGFNLFRDNWDEFKKMDLCRDLSYLSDPNRDKNYIH